MIIAFLGYSLCIFSLYCMAGGFVATAFGARQEIFLPLFFTCVACNVLGAIMHKLPKGVRVLVVIPILLLAFFFRGIQEYALLLIPAVIVGAIQLSGKYYKDHYDFKRLFFKMLIAVAILLLLLLFFEYMGDLGAYFTVVYVVAGILTLRQLRQDDAVGGSTKFMLSNSVPMILFVVLMAVLGNANVLDKAIAGVGWVFGMIGKGILLIFGGIGYLFMLLFKREELAVELAEEAAEATERPTQAPKAPWQFAFGENRDNTAMLIALAAIVLLIISAVIVISILNHGRRVRSGSGGSSLEKRSRYRGGLGQTASGAVQSAPTKGSAGIRSLYKKWLKLLKKRNVIIVKSDTSLDVLDRRAPSTVPYEAHKTLRGLYVKARYDEGYSPTREEQHAAKAAYEQLASSDFNTLNERHWDD